MKKVKLRIICNLLILQIIFGIFSNVFASELKTSLDVIQQASETKYLENDQGYISKTIINSNASTGEVTVELKLSNKKKEEEQVKYDSTELVFVVDNSLSMKEKVTDEKTRRDVVIESAKKFTENLFKDVKNLKIGLTYYYGFDTEDEGQTSVQSFGTIDTAKIVTDLTDNEENIINSLDSLKNIEYNYGTNTDAGLRRAYSMFSNSDTTQKFIILLSDGVPNHAIDVSIAYGGLLGQTEEQHLESVNRETKATIETIDNSKVNLITMLTGLKDLSEEETNTLNTVFGTIEKPTAGSLYNIDDADISSIIQNEIYKEVLEKVQNPMNSVKITDYFPTDIIDNFEFSYVGKPSIGTASTGIDTKTNTIEWNIGTLKGDEVATLQYKLKIKDMKNQKLLNKTISTNEKVVLNYTDTDATDYTVTLSSSPKIQLSEVKDINIGGDIDINGNVEINGNINGGNGGSSKKDNTTATGNIPQTGMNYAAISAIALIAIISIVSYKKYTNYKDVK